MAHPVETEHDAPVSTLLAGIVEDAKHLFVEQMTLFQVEIKNDVNRAVSSLIRLAIGTIMAIPALVLLGLAFAHGLHHLFPNLPLWASFTIVGGAATLIAGGLIYWGIQSLSNVTPTPDTALKGLKENLQWKTKN